MSLKLSGYASDDRSVRSAFGDRCGKGVHAEGAEQKPAKVAMENKQRQKQEQTQIPFGNDNKKSKGYSLASCARARARMRVPRAMDSGVAYSSGRWETPLRQGMKSMATGAMRAMKLVSW